MGRIYVFTWIAKSAAVTGVPSPALSELSPALASICALVISTPGASDSTVCISFDRERQSCTALSGGDGIRVLC
ncbi:hypothetical protein T492DRAFT_945900 [Pavlovales sp. CCMP2436]|nr:hypothetical protein T492DRAFT_945900 [Pavlovales sp. CCMP2436]